MTYEELKKEAQDYDDIMSVIIDDDLYVIKERGNQLMAIINRTGGMIADAKLLLDEKMNSEVIRIIKDISGGAFSAKVQNALVDSIAKEERWLYNRVEQLNKTAKYQIEWCRSILSQLKEEMKYQNFG